MHAFQSAGSLLACCPSAATPSPEASVLGHFTHLPTHALRPPPTHTRTCAHSWKLPGASSVHCRTSHRRVLVSASVCLRLSIRTSACPPWPATAAGLPQARLEWHLLVLCPESSLGVMQPQLLVVQGSWQMVALQRSLSQPSKVGCCIFQHGPLSSVLFVFLLVSSPSTHNWNVNCLKAGSLTWSLLCPQQWTVGPSSCGHLHVVRCVDSLAPGLNQQVCTTSLMWTGWFLKRPTLFSCESSGQNAIYARLVEKENIRNIQ